jgi:hypothetical protein
MDKINGPHALIVQCQVSLFFLSGSTVFFDKSATYVDVAYLKFFKDLDMVYGWIRCGTCVWFGRPYQEIRASLIIMCVTYDKEKNRLCPNFFVYLGSDVELA